jgi:hypothetical protein
MSDWTPFIHPFHMFACHKYPVAYPGPYLGCFSWNGPSRYMVLLMILGPMPQRSVPVSMIPVLYPRPAPGYLTPYGRYDMPVTHPIGLGHVWTCLMHGPYLPVYMVMSSHRPYVPFTGIWSFLIMWGSQRPTFQIRPYLPITGTQRSFATLHPCSGRCPMIGRFALLDRSFIYEGFVDYWYDNHTIG